MRLLAQAAGQQHLFLLSAGVAAHVPGKLRALKVQLAQYGQQQRLVHAACSGVVVHAAGEARGVLRHIGYDQSAADLHPAGVGHVLAQQQAQKAALAAAVAAGERDPVAAFYLQPHAGADVPTAVVHAHAVEARQRLRAVGQRRELERLGALGVLQQLGLALYGALLAGLDVLGALHQLGRLVSHKALVRRPALGRLRPVRPVGRARRGLLHAAYVPFEPVVQLLLGGLPRPEVLHPGRKAAAPDLRAGAVQRQYVVNAAVQEAPVVRHEYEAALAAQPGRDPLSRGRVQVVRRLVNQMEVPLVEKERREHGLGLLTV